jgi:predicted 3-demethylubiquinone-9 3-methyltransferase (glyoxalase superfamily)
MTIRQRIAPCLWFDHQAEEAARFYTGMFPNSKVGRISRYGAAGREFHRKEPGTVMTVEFELDGQPFTALNGGPIFTFNEAISLQVYCGLAELVSDPGSEKSQRAMVAVLQMKKIDIAQLERAYAG